MNTDPAGLLPMSSSLRGCMQSTAHALQDCNHPDHYLQLFAALSTPAKNALDKAVAPTVAFGCRFAVRENDGADYVISLGGRINSSLLDLIPAYCNVRVRFVDNSTMHSDTCSFHRALVDFGKLDLLNRSLLA